MSVWQHSPAMAVAVMWFGAGMLPRLRTISREQLQQVAEQAGEISLGYPLHMAGPAKQFLVPQWDATNKLSGCQVVALMVFGLWVLCNEDKEIAGGLYDSWPIAEAVLLAGAKERTP